MKRPERAAAEDADGRVWAGVEAVDHPIWPEPASRCDPGDAHRLFSFAFGTAKEADDATAGRFTVPLEVLSEGDDEESWFTDAPVTHGRSGPILWRQSRRVIAAHLSTPLSSSVAADTREAYGVLLSFLRRQGFPYLLRVWNVMPDINRGDGDNEVYRQFCLGRSTALQEAGVGEGELPAATAVGGDPEVELTITAIAADCRGLHLENPRQLSAYRYPRRYGPKSPAFARATAVATGLGDQLLISGTASIVGHRTVHDDDVQRQLAETRRNLAALTQRAGCTAGVPPLLGYGRVYLRRRDDLDAVRGRLADLCSGSLTILRGDICRRDLLLEIEGSHTL